MGGCFEPCRVVRKEKQLKTSLAFSTLFIPVSLVIKLKIHVPFRLMSVLSTRVCILELLWSAPLEIWGALALSLVTFLSAIPLWSPRGSAVLRGWWCQQWARRGPGTPQAADAAHPWDCRGHLRCRSPGAADS